MRDGVVAICRLDPNTWVQKAEKDPRERACAAALPPSGCQQSGRSSQAAFCVTEDARRFHSRQLGDEVLQHWFQPHVRRPT